MRLQVLRGHTMVSVQSLLFYDTDKVKGEGHSRNRIFFVLTNKRGSTIGLAGWGIWLIFVAIFGMGAC